jgi:hypothetical protein
MRHPILLLLHPLGRSDDGELPRVVAPGQAKQTLKVQIQDLAHEAGSLPGRKERVRYNQKAVSQSRWAQSSIARR